MSDDTIRMLAVGAVTQDVHLTGEALHERLDPCTHAAVEQFPLGAKLELDGVAFSVGGGASNAAVTFARQGLSSAFVGKVGDDLPGREVLRALAAEGVGTDGVRLDEEHGTAYAAILLTETGERTVLVYRGASQALVPAELVAQFPLHADWLYITSLGGDLALLGLLLRHAAERSIKVALNPGQGELARPRELRTLLPLVELLMANREELTRLFGGTTPRQTLRIAMPACPYVVMTDGPDGCHAGHRGEIVSAGVYRDVPVVDRLGAGGAFCSGFTTAIARGAGVEAALTLGAANATGVVGRVGAKAGILRADETVLPMPVQRVRAWTRLPDGLVLRTVRPADGPALEQLLTELSPEALQRRFLTGAVDLHRAARWATHPELVDAVGLVVEGPAGLVAHGVLVPDGASSGEVAFEVSAPWRRHGIAGVLLQALEDQGRARGLSMLVADVLWENVDMLAVFRERGPTSETPDGTVIHVAMAVAA